MSDAAARARALDPRTSFIVRAPAGSGKTELLIQRYLRLLAEVEVPESIVAVTFTRKAAGEMRARVLEALRAADGPRPEAAHKALTYDLARAALERSRLAGWRLLENPARVRMQTIDSLCASITRQMPWVARFGAIPEIIEKAGPLYSEAARLTLTGPERRDAIARLLLHLDNNFSRAQSLVAQMLERRDQWLRHVMQKSVREQVERCLARIIEDAMRAARQASIEAGLRDLPGVQIEEAAAWNVFANELLTLDGKWRKKNPVAQSLSGNDRLQECLNDVRKLPAACFTDEQWQVMEAIVELLPVAAFNLSTVFRERGAVDFVELSLASLRALADREGLTDLGFALGYSIQHILLDEFQDTSYTQYDLLQRLTATWDEGDGRTLFLVGDPMQSIYRFRQAEVGLFLDAWRSGIGNVALEPLTLSVNFRSGAEIVEWVNATFRDLFPSDEDSVYGAVSYSASAAADRSGGAGIEVHAFAGENTRAAEAERVAALVADAREQDSVGILVRARSHLPAILAALKGRGIRYQAIEIDELGERVVTQDLMALTFALLHPGNRVAKAAVLRAPWCGLTLEDLETNAAGERRARTEAVLAAAVAERGRRTLRDLVEQTWIRLGGPACLRSESDMDDANAYFDLIETLDEGGDIADFDLLREQVRGLFAQPDSLADGRVQVMTIHKAKGLEFDTVLLPGLGAHPKREEGQLILWHEPAPNELLFAPINESGSDEDNGIYRHLARIEQRKMDNEAIRLLYVAVTRARTNLHLLGCAAVKRDGLTAAAGSFLKILWPAVERHYTALPLPDVGLMTNKTERRPQPIRRFVAGWTLPEPPRAVAWIGAGEPVADSAPISYEWVGDTLRHVGTVVHAFLARIAREGLERWNDVAVRSRERSIRAMLRNLGVASTEIDSAGALVVDALLRAISDERGRWLLGDHGEGATELAIGGVVGGRIVDVVIDRTFVDDRGVRWIVDYKTGTHGGGSVEKFLAEEKRRYQEQLERYARLWAQREDRPIRLGLYFPLVEEGWIEWEARALERRQATLFAD